MEFRGLDFASPTTGASHLSVLMGAVMTETQASDLVKVTVNLIPESYEALKRAADTLGDTHSETINRALQLYDAVTQLRSGMAMTFDLRPDEDLTLVCMTAAAATEGRGCVFCEDAKGRLKARGRGCLGGRLS